MARKGQNPAKGILTAAQPEPVTVAVVTYIPFLSGYYEESLAVLDLCLKSILENTRIPFDLMVFDNHSCEEAVRYLEDLHARGEIQFLVLSNKNVGKVGAWNFIFGAAPGEMIAYCDSDVYFLPNWLSKHLELFDAFPNVGTVTGLPRRGLRKKSAATLKLIQAMDMIELKRGKFIPDAWLLDHADSLGKLGEIDDDLACDDTLIRSQGVDAYVTASHFQFVLRSETARKLTPLNYSRPMGPDLVQLDAAMDEMGLLRLATAERLVLHIGNTLEPTIEQRLGSQWTAELSTAKEAPQGDGFLAEISEWKFIKRILLAIYNRIFKLYFSRTN